MSGLDRRSLLAASVALPMLRPATGHAQAFPSRPVRIIVPAAPGGILDTTARSLAPGLSERLGQSVVVENRSGAGGTIGVTAARNAEPDGHSLLLAHTGEMAINPALMANLPYDPERDFQPVAGGLVAANVLIGHAGAGFSTLTEMVAAARARPGQMAYASPGNGTLNHIATEMFATAAGISLTHVPYRGGGPAGLAVATGEVSLALLALPTALPHVQSGRARVLAVMLRDRSPLSPDWPTAREGGVDVESRIWTGFFAQRAVPAPVVATLTRAILAELASPALRERVAAAGAVPMPLDAPAFGAMVTEEARRFATFVRDRNFRLD